MHWADDATCDAITVLGRRIGSLPALVVLTFRGGEARPDHPLHAAIAALSAAERVADGGSALDPKVVGSLVSPAGADDPPPQLSESERNVLSLVAEGFSNAAIAKRLYLSERTVEAHVRHVLMKLDIPQSDETHRRVLAVLAYLGAAEAGTSSRL